MRACSSLSCGHCDSASCHCPQPAVPTFSALSVPDFHENTPLFTLISKHNSGQQTQTGHGGTADRTKPSLTGSSSRISLQMWQSGEGRHKPAGCLLLGSLGQAVEVLVLFKRISIQCISFETIIAQCAVEPTRPQSHCLHSRTAQCYESHIVILSPPTLKTVFMTLALQR